MLEHLSEQYLRLVANFRILMFNPSDSFEVDALRILSLALLSIMLFRLGAGAVVFRRLKKRLSRYDESRSPRLMAAYRSAATALGMRRIPPLFQSWNSRPAAFTVGLFRPAVFLSPRLAERLPERTLAAVLTHELVHAKRRDNLRSWCWEVIFASLPALIVLLFGLNFILSGTQTVVMIGSAIGALVVFRWCLRGPVQSFRERLCDDMTVAVSDDRLALAEALITVWRISRRWPRHDWRLNLPSLQTLLSAGSDLEQRIQRLIEGHDPRMTIAATRLVRVTMILLAVSGTGFLVWFYSSAYPHRLPMGFDCLTVTRIFESSV